MPDIKRSRAPLRPCLDTAIGYKHMTYEPKGDGLLRDMIPV
jgi:hypothetical protein